MKKGGGGGVNNSCMNPGGEEDRIGQIRSVSLNNRKKAIREDR